MGKSEATEVAECAIALRHSWKSYMLNEGVGKMQAPQHGSTTSSSRWRQPYSSTLSLCSS